MPPANSPTGTETFDASVNEDLLDILGHAASPPALTSREEQVADDDNVSFLRTMPPSASNDESERATADPSEQPAWMENLLLDPRITQSERETVRRLRRYVLQSGRSLSPATSSALELRRMPYARSRPDGRLADYQGWAPGSTENDVVEPPMTMSGLRALARASTRRGQSEHQRTLTRETLQPIRHMIGSREMEDERDLTQTIQPPRPATMEMDWEPQTSSGPSVARELDGTDGSLRMTALLHSVRRHARFSSRPPLNQDAADDSNGGAASRMLLERERPAGTRRNALDASALGARLDASTLSLPPISGTSPAGTAAASRPSGRLRNHRGSARSEGSKWLEEAIKYLERLRSCDSHSEWMKFAEAGGFVRDHVFTYHNQRNDFVMDTSKISPPPPSSWLRAGSVFSGSQKSTACMNLSLPPMTQHAYSQNQPLTSLQLQRRTPGLEPDPITRAVGSNGGRGGSSTAASPRVPWIYGGLSRNRISAENNSGSGGGSSGSSDESWPVKVTITSVDYDKMRLTGTMEAFDVPNRICPSQNTTIATYLEGEIIDFQSYTLETTSFNATSGVDSTYWRELEPFQSLSDSEIVHNLLSSKWLCEELSQKYILMRWKEQCFIRPSDAQVHLTISGFYYVSLRRSDGRLEGLYYDPSSTPYQHLVLKAESHTFPSYSFFGPQLYK